MDSTSPDIRSFNDHNASRATSSASLHGESAALEVLEAGSQNPENALEAFVTTLGLIPVEKVLLGRREPRYAPAPKGLAAAATGLVQQCAPSGLFTHQAEALSHVVSGRSVVVSTPTASGKSLTFMAAALHVLTSEPGSRVLALYPTKSLIRDQLSRWTAAFGGAGRRVVEIHGGVPAQRRLELLSTADVVLATPDVVHSWLLRTNETSYFLSATRLLILDEAHAYDGVFGSQMAFLMRRLRASSGISQVVATTATLAAPSVFVRDLTGMEVESIGPERDGSPSAGIRFIRLESLDAAERVRLLAALANQPVGRFLAFTDTRMGVERTAIEVHEALGGPADSQMIVPYRSGYEESDRETIERSLKSGRLRGVISTSALELGIDIGELDVVILLNPPATQRALLQRAGRVGRGGRPGTCLLVTPPGETLAGLLARPVEPSRLYLDNTRVQFTQALCAAWELRARGVTARPDVFKTLPVSFNDFLEGELDPVEALPDDLMELKARMCADGAPHLKLQLRSGGEDSWTVELGANAAGEGRGTLSTSQMLREAYPGAIYVHQAKRYRVERVISASRQVIVSASRVAARTSPICLTRAFPKVGAVLGERVGGGFTIIETHLQVSHQVVGFRERRGQTWTESRYKLGSRYRESPIAMGFATTGVVIVVDGERTLSDGSMELLLEALRHRRGIADGDVGLASIVAAEGRLSSSKLRGACVVDTTPGSLRLSQALIDDLEAIVDLAIELAGDDVPGDLLALSKALPSLRSVAAPSGAMTAASTPGDYRVLAPDQEVLLKDGPLEKLVTVVGYRFGPAGLQYELRNGRPGTWHVRGDQVRPLDDDARWLELDELGNVKG